MRTITFITTNGLSLEGTILSEIGHAEGDTWYIVFCQDRLCYVSKEGKQISKAIDLISLTFPSL